ncbi:MAG: hypothetical protein ACI9OU_001763 [Candidatus Promineifilaceae bacterium]|jgi:hypothetical protein
MDVPEWPQATLAPRALDMGLALTQADPQNLALWDGTIKGKGTR